MSQSPVTVNGAALIADLSGALWWPDRRTLIVADLHLEKGSSRAARGVLLPPYDTVATLDRLDAAARRFRPDRIVCLGDSFHDRDAPDRLPAPAVERLRRLAAGHECIWVTGNHDPAPPTRWGAVRDELVIGPLVLRHAARPGAVGELSGHYHPKAAIHVRARRIGGRCFVGDGRRMILPAFGAYAGGLNVLDRAVSGLLERDFTVHLLGDRQIYAFPRSRLSADPSMPLPRLRAGT